MLLQCTLQINTYNKYVPNLNLLYLYTIKQRKENLPIHEVCYIKLWVGVNPDKKSSKTRVTNNVGIRLPKANDVVPIICCFALFDVSFRTKFSFLEGS